MTVIARNYFDARPELASDIKVFDPGMTKQADADACDINKLMKRYERTGVLPDMIRQDGRYGDFSSVPDYQSALDIVRTANEQFEALEAPVRARFGNDPKQFLEFVENPDNLEEMGKLGLLNESGLAKLEKKRKDDREAFLKAEEGKAGPAVPPAQ